MGIGKKWPLVALGRWSPYAVVLDRKLRREESKVAVVGRWSPCKGGRLSRFDCMKINAKDLNEIHTLNHIHLLVHLGLVVNKYNNFSVDRYEILPFCLACISGKRHLGRIFIIRLLSRTWLG